MNIQAVTANTTDWNKVLRISFCVIWWLLKAVFKVALVLGSIVIAILAFVLVRDEPKENEKVKGVMDHHWDDDDIFTNPQNPMYVGNENR